MRCALSRTAVMFCLSLALLSTAVILLNCLLNRPKGALVSGKVVEDKTQKPIADVLVTARGQGMNFHAITDHQGHFKLRLPPGPFLIFGSGIPKGFIHGFVNLTVKPGEKLSITLTVEPAVSVKGRVLSPQGHPVMGVQIYALSPFWSEPQAESDTDGNFSFEPLDRCPWTGIVLAMDRERHLVAHVQIQHQEVKEAHILLRLQPTARAEGRVLSEDGKSIANAVIETWAGSSFGNSTPIGRKVKTDGRGKFQLVDIVPELRYFVRASARGYLNQTYHSFMTRAGQNYQLPPAKLKRTDSFIAGIVTDPNGEPIPNIGVLVSIGTSGKDIGWTTTDSNGKFKIRYLPKGKVRVKLARYPDYEIWEGAVMTGQRNLRFVLKPGPGSKPDLGKRAHKNSSKRTAWLTSA